MSRDEEFYDHTTITRKGKLVEGKEKPKNWALHYYEVRADGQWAPLTYRFEAEINPNLSFDEAREAISKLRSSQQESDEEILNFLEKMAQQEKRFTMDSLFAVKR